MKTELLKFKPSDTVLKKCERFIEIFKEYNSHTNLMSKNDLNVIFEKHIVDSLSVSELKEFQDSKKILDIGTGGGFPSIPLAIFFEDKKITAVDSIQKKIRFIELAKTELGLENLTPLCSRIEELEAKEKFDIVVSRALASLDKIILYAIPYLNKGGYIIAYKSKNAQDELKNAEKIMKKNKITFKRSVSYTLECSEKYERCLIVLKKEE